MSLDLIAKKYRPHNAEEALKSVTDEGRGGHRLEEYVLERVNYDEDGEAEEYEFLGRAEFDGLIIYLLQCMSCTAPKKQADWRNCMVTDADPAHVVKELEGLDWFLSKQEAVKVLDRRNSYVGEYGEAYEYQIEEIIIGDLDDDGTWQYGDVDVAPYPYIKVYVEDRYHTAYRFEAIFDSIADADWEIATESFQERLDFDDDIAIHYIDMDGNKIKTISVDSLREEEDE